MKILLIFDLLTIDCLHASHNATTKTPEQAPYSTITISDISTTDIIELVTLCGCPGCPYNGKEMNASSLLTSSSKQLFEFSFNFFVIWMYV